MAQAFVGVCPEVYKMQVAKKTKSKKDQLSKTNIWDVVIICIFLNILQKMLIPFCLKYFSTNSNTPNSNTQWNYPLQHGDQAK